MILFIDLFIDLRYYFDMNNGGLKVYKQILFFTLILFIDLFIDFIDLVIDLRYYFDTNNRFKSIQANFIFYMHTFNICFLDIICNPDENLLWIANYI